MGNPTTGPEVPELRISIAVLMGGLLLLRKIMLLEA
jgi:hypothetical protein